MKDKSIDTKRRNEITNILPYDMSLHTTLIKEKLDTHYCLVIIIYTGYKCIVRYLSYIDIYNKS